MLRSLIAGAACVVVVSASALPAHAIVLYNESANGDLSGNRLAPSAFTLSLGTNSLLATSAGGDLEYVKLTVPASMHLDHINVVSYQSADARAFIGVQAGSIFTETPASPNVANILGYTHFGTGPGNVGTDILDDMGIGSGAIGFTPPLASGPYTFWIQQLGASTSYQFDFVTSPEPGTAAGLGALGLVMLRRARR